MWMSALSCELMSHFDRVANANDVAKLSSAIEEEQMLTCHFQKKTAFVLVLTLCL